MYLPPHFDSKDSSLAAELMRRHAFASLVSTDEGGFPFVSHLPLHLEERDGLFVLHGHCAKPNPQWRHLQARPQALVTFMAAQAYQSPRIYEDKERVPSWNYIAVHCRVRARLIEGDDAKDAMLKRLIGDHEPAYASQWQSMSPVFAHKMLAGIVAFELDVESWQCKVKLNQHRPESHQALRDQYAAGNSDERELAQWMERLAFRGLGGSTK